MFCSELSHADWIHCIIWLQLEYCWISIAFSGLCERTDVPVAGGGKGKPIMTAYRQQALACAAALAGGPLRPRDLKPVAATAGQILLKNYYGWFVKIDKGLYGLSDSGAEALKIWQKPL